ncbi:MAG: OmpA family protein [Saprospiraceae bacterium]|nr:OmpA family protein [Saprospiraceae bacterium]
MKKLFLSLFMLLLLGSVTLEAQEQSFHALSAKFLLIDYGTPNSIEDLDITNGIEIGYTAGLNKYLGLAVPIKIGSANVFGDVNNRSLFSIDGLLRLHYAPSESKIIPYLIGGAGYVVERDGPNNLQFPMGVGFDIKLGKNSYLNLQGEYRISQETNRNNLQLGAGLVYRLGKMDRDRDGVADAIDKCPDIAGLKTLDGCPDRDGDGIADADDDCPDAPGNKATNGCPDTDGDGVIDKNDDCPDEPGPAELRGCPDTDSDGIADKDDNCPNEKGLAALNGCPDRDGDSIADGDDECPDEKGSVENKGCPVRDRDGDGIADATDKCPDEKGVASAMGCPDRDGDSFVDANDKCPDTPGTMEGCPDTDGDGVHDGDDRCPKEAGLAINKGCPEIKKEIREVLNFAMRAVQFETGKATLKKQSFAVLDQIVEIMAQYPAYRLVIAGHTDNVGNDKANLTLSENRAKACQQYLISKGVSAKRLSYAGYGESQPLADNKTAKGRELNRRVEFDLIIQ